jgi:hypothetical protein
LVGASVPQLATVWQWTAVKSSLVLGFTGALVTTGWLTLRTVSPITRSVATDRAAFASASAAEVDEEPAPPAAPLPANVTIASSRVPIRRKPPLSPTPSEAPNPTAASLADGSLRAETEALRLAQQSLRDKSPQRALQLLDEQDARFRGGLLHQERAAARILALCQAGRAGEASSLAVRFERQWPRSALLGRIRSACRAP